MDLEMLKKIAFKELITNNLYQTRKFSTILIDVILLKLTAKKVAH